VGRKAHARSCARLNTCNGAALSLRHRHTSFRHTEEVNTKIVHTYVISHRIRTEMFIVLKFYALIRK
jgi:hypothetical protein